MFLLGVCVAAVMTPDGHLPVPGLQPGAVIRVPDGGGCVIVVGTIDGGSGDDQGQGHGRRQGQAQKGLAAFFHGGSLLSALVVPDT